MAPRTFSTAEDVYHAALALPPTDRDAFLDEACGGDAELRREVGFLLSLRDDAKRLLDEPIPQAATRPVGLAPGARIGHFEVAELIDTGGMGEVYRARDTSLRRDVALKVLPPAFSRDPDRVARLEREAHLLASLSHPNIESIYGLEEFDGRHALVLELLPGTTLEKRLARGPVEVPQAIDVALQVARALAAAHDGGVLHRDVKPGNVIVTPDGRVKLLDFGLAKTVPAEPRSTDEAALSQGGSSEIGAILGTAPYMSPEQARGEPVDRRTDAWSLGCVLFEMLTGERAFPGATPAESIAKVLGTEPRWDALPADTPAVVRSLLRRCLRKDRSRRLQDLADAALELEEALHGDVPAAREKAVEDRRPAARERAGSWARGLSLLVLGLLVGAAAGHWNRRRPSPPVEPAVFRSQIDLDPGRPLLARTHESSRTELAVSPDGSLLAWVSATEARGAMLPGPDTALELRRLDTGEVTRLRGTEGASQPFFSPDGRWIGFISYDGDRWFLRKVGVDGSLPVDVAELSGWPMGASWTAGGRILLGGIASDRARGLVWVSEEGGTPKEFTTPETDREVGHRLPRALPGGRTVLFTTMPDPYGVRSRVEAVRLDGGSRTVVVEDAADARYLPTGHLVFARQGVLMAAPFDLRRLELAGAPVPVIPAVAQALNRGNNVANSGAVQLAVSDSGLVVYAAGGMTGDVAIRAVTLDEKGSARPFPGLDRPLLSPQFDLSPDGRQLAFVEQARSGLAWLFDLQRRTYTPLSRAGVAATPRWSPDGSRLALSWSKAGPLGVWVLPANGRSDWLKVAPVGYSPEWSPDGRVLAFCNDGDILLYRFSDRRVVPFVTGEGALYDTEFSPDGRWLAYRSNRSGRAEVYVTSFPNREKTLTVSNSRASSPAWSRDGRRLHYVRVEGASPASRRRFMMAVDVRPGPPLTLGTPVTLFELPAGLVSLAFRFYEILPDGRFLVGVHEEQDPSPRITRLQLVQGWFSELERLSPRVQ